MLPRLAWRRSYDGKMVYESIAIPFLKLAHVITVRVEVIFELLADLTTALAYLFDDWAVSDHLSSPKDKASVV